MNDSQTTSDPQLCRQCGGLCCQGHPGLWTDPERFQKLFPLLPATAAELAPLLAPKQLTLRDVGDVLIPAPQKTSAGCIFLASDGCRLPFDRRPDQCLALTPQLDTLLEGEMRCTMPPEHGSNSARGRWRAFWADAEYHKKTARN